MNLIINLIKLKIIKYIKILKVCVKLCKFFIFEKKFKMKILLNFN